MTSAITDRIRVRTVRNIVVLIEEHLEYMQRDFHGLEYAPWKNEVDELWKRVFEEINLMSERFQAISLKTITELWTMYLAHYATDRKTG